MRWFFGQFRHARHDAWHAPDFAAACDARAIDFDANFARLAALVAKKAKRESQGRTSMRMTKLGGALLGAAVGILAAVTTVPAQDAAATYPNKPIRVIVPFAAGGGNDIFARLVGQKLSEILGQSLIIENRPAAGGRVSAEFVASQPADGYTLFVGASGVMSISAAVYPKLSYHPTKSFVPLSMIASFPLIMVSPINNPAKTV